MDMATEKPVVEIVPVFAGMVIVYALAVDAGESNTEPPPELLTCKPPVDGMRSHSVPFAANATVIDVGKNIPFVDPDAPVSGGTPALPSGVAIPVEPLMTTAIVMLRVAGYSG